MLIAVTSLKGRFVTTFAVALAATWPDEAPVVVEADCAGGDLAARHWLPDSPGVTTLATQSRAGNVNVNVEDHIVRMPCGVDAVLAPAGRGPATVAVGLLAEADAATWAKQRPTVADLGRLEPGAPSAGLADLADIVLILTAGDEASLLRLAEADLPRHRAQIVLVGRTAYSSAEIGDRTAMPVLGAVPWDTRAAAILSGAQQPRRGWTRRGLPAAARAIAVELAHSHTSTYGEADQ